MSCQLRGPCANQNIVPSFTLDEHESRQSNNSGRIEHSFDHGRGTRSGGRRKGGVRGRRRRRGVNHSRRGGRRSDRDRDGHWHWGDRGCNGNRHRDIVAITRTVLRGTLHIREKVGAVKVSRGPEGANFAASASRGGYINIGNEFRLLNDTLGAVHN